jgi:hypothetical protein
MATMDDVRRIAMSLPRTSEHLMRTVLHDNAARILS